MLSMYPVEERDAVEEVRVHEGQCAGRLAEPRPLQLQEPAGSRAAPGEAAAVLGSAGHCCQHHRAAAWCTMPSPSCCDSQTRGTPPLRLPPLPYFHPSLRARREATLFYTLLILLLIFAAVHSLFPISSKQLPPLLSLTEFSLLVSDPSSKC